MNWPITPDGPVSASVAVIINSDMLMALFSSKDSDSKFGVNTGEAWFSVGKTVIFTMAVPCIGSG